MLPVIHQREPLTLLLTSLMLALLASCSGVSTDTLVTPESSATPAAEATATTSDTASTDSSTPAAAAEIPAPTGTSVLITGGATTTFTTAVNLTLAATDAADMYITNTSNCESGGDWEAYATSKSWTLSRTTTGTATVYAKFRSALGGVSTCTSADILAILFNSTVSHFAGGPGGTGKADGIGTAARFNAPNGITSDGTHLFVADKYNSTIRQILISTGEVVTLAGTAGTAGPTSGAGAISSLNTPTYLTTDGTNVYVTDSVKHTIQKVVISTGAISTFAGLSGTSGSTNDTGAAARFNTPNGITNDGTNLYVADSGNNAVRKIVISSGVVTTLASGFTSITGIIRVGNSVFVADSGNRTVKRVLTADGTVSIFAGASGLSATTDNATGTSARFAGIFDITSDNSANLFVINQSAANGMTIRQIAFSGSQAVTTLAGNASASDSYVDATGTSARFNSPSGITSDGTNLYVTESGGGASTVRQIVISSGVVTTLAGSPNMSGSTNATGTLARFYLPSDITSDGTNFYVVDSGNFKIRKTVIATGVVSTFAGSSQGFTNNTTGTSARFDTPGGITNDGTNLYVTDTANNCIRQIVIATGAVTTIAGDGVSGSPGTGGNSGHADNATGTLATFNNPMGITNDGTNLYVADNGNHIIRKIVIATGAVTTLAGLGGAGHGLTNGTGTAARFYYPNGIIRVGANLYVTDSTNHVIRKIVISTGEVSTLAGSGVASSVNDTGLLATFSNPIGITSDGTNLYVTDGDTLIRKIVIGSGVVTTLAGNTAVGSDDGAIANALFHFSGFTGMTVVGSSLYIVDGINNAIRKID